MREAEADLEALNVDVAVVTFDVGLLAEGYAMETGLSWPLLLDRERTLYRAYGMLSARSWVLYAPSPVWAYLKLLAKGRRLRRAGGDIRQRGGDVLVDPAGIVRLHHVGRGPAHRPSVASILDIVRDGSAGP